MGAWWGFVCALGIAEVPPPAVPPAESSVGLTLSLAFDKGGWFVPVSLDREEDRGWLLLDTGASRTKLAQEALSPSMVTLRLGRLTADIRSTARLRVDQVAPLGRRRVLGILGGDFFIRHAMKLDPRKKELVVFDSGVQISLPSIEWLPSTLMGQTTVVKAFVCGQEGRFLLDSGAGGVVLSPSFAGRIGLDQRKLRPFVVKTIGGMGGSMRVRTTIVDSLAVGPLTLQQPVVDVEGADFGGLAGTIGQPVLQEAMTWWDPVHERLGIECYPDHRSVMVSAYGYDRLAVRDLGAAGRHQEAATASATLRALYPEEMDPVIWEAGALSAMGRHDEAANVMDEAIVKFPDRLELLGNLPSAYFNQKKYRKAVEVAERAHRTCCPDDAYLLDVLADGYRLLKEPEQSYHYALRYARCYPWKPDAEFKLAVAAVEARHFEEAVSLLKPNLSRNGGDGALYLAKAHVGLSQPQEALTVLEQFREVAVKNWNYPRARAALKQFLENLKSDRAFEPIKSDPRFLKVSEPSPEP